MSAADHPLLPVILPATYGLDLDLELVGVPAWLDGELSSAPGATVRRRLEADLEVGVVRREKVLTNADPFPSGLPADLEENMRALLRDTATASYKHVRNADLEAWKLSREELF